MKKLVIASALLLLAFPVFADDVTDRINEGLKAYEKGDYQSAVDSLNAARALVQQKESEGLVTFLPNPLPGWELDKTDNTSLAAETVGGSVSAVRRFTKKLDDMTTAEVTVSLVTDSPFMQSLSALMNNAAFMNDVNKIVEVEGRNVVKNLDEKKMQAIVNNKTLVTVKGSRGADIDVVSEYFKAINFEGIEKIK